MEMLEEFEKRGIELDGPTVELKPYEFEFGVIVEPKIKTEFDAIGMVCSIVGEGRCYLLLSDERPDILTLTHEVMHVLDELEIYIHDHLEREARAFIVQSIMQNVFNFIGLGGSQE